MGCTQDSECQNSETCRNANCVNPCLDRSPCAKTAVCLAENHRAICSCSNGMIGNPFTNCFREIITVPQCTNDNECSNTEACINQKCQNPCAENNPCSGNAECRVSLHRPLCYCPNGWGGDPKIQCFKRKY